MKTFLMMSGELDGLNSFLYPYIKNQMNFGPMSLLFMIIFIILMPILLTNLLVTNKFYLNSSFIILWSYFYLCF